MSRRDSIAAKLGSWMSKAKGRASEHLENPDSKTNQVKRGVKGHLIKAILGSESATDDEKVLVHQSILE